MPFGHASTRRRAQLSALVVACASFGFVGCGEGDKSATQTVEPDAAAVEVQNQMVTSQKTNPPPRPGSSASSDVQRQMQRGGRKR